MAPRTQRSQQHANIEDRRQLIDEDVNEMERNIDESLTADEGGSRDGNKKTRGPTYMSSIWGLPDGKKIKIKSNEYGQPIGKNQSKLSHFLGTLSRNGRYAPIHISDWHKMPMSRKKDLLEVIKDKFVLPPGIESWIFQSLGTKWRNWKSKLKQKYFDPTKTTTELMDMIPQRVIEDQWKRIIAYWQSEPAEVASNRNMNSRKQKKLSHKTGKKSFAQIRHEKTKELKRPPTRCEMFDHCFPTENDHPSEELIQVKEKMKQISDQLPDPALDSTSPNDSFAQVMGQEKHGRLHMYGLGVTPSDVFGELPSRKTCHRMVMQYQDEMKQMEERFTNQIAELKQIMLQRNTHMDGQVDPNTGPPSSSSHLHRPSSNGSMTAPISLRAGQRVVLKSIINCSEIVAKGFIQCVEPCAQVGGEDLGENWSEVHILVPVKRNERLIRSYGFFKTIGDSIGVSIAWPNSLIERDEE